jgi:hypothetical protein
MRHTTVSILFVPQKQEFVKMKHFPFLILVVFLAKSLVVPPGLFDACVTISMAALAYARYRQDHLEALASKNWDSAVKEFNTRLDYIEAGYKEELDKTRQEVTNQLKKSDERVAALDRFLTGPRKVKAAEDTQASGLNWF